jgi:hypothetical protein
MWRRRCVPHFGMYNYADKKTNRLEMSGSVGGLSQLSMEKDDMYDSLEYPDSSLELKQRLEELERMTLAFLNPRFYVC